MKSTILSTSTYIEINLQPEDKSLLLYLAASLIDDPTTLADLRNGRRRWIRFTHQTIFYLVGELSYQFNSGKNVAQLEVLDELIGALEIYLK